MRAQPRTRAEIIRDLREAVQRYKGNFVAADLFDAAATTAPSTPAELKEWAQVGRTAAMNLAKKVELRTQKELLDAVEAQLRSVYNKVVTGQQPAIILAAFEEWKGTYPGEDAWDYFRQLQSKVSGPATEAKDAKVVLKAIDQNGGRATRMAVQMRNGFPQGPNDNVGTVCAGLADSAGGVWGGSSGHGQALHAVMSSLLSGVQQVENWPVHVCGEVDAMNQYLNARGIGSIEQIPRGELYSHAETWKEPAKDDQKGKWASRGACNNCEQWLNKIEANMV